MTPLVLLAAGAAALLAGGTKKKGASSVASSAASGVASESTELAKTVTPLGSLLGDGDGAQWAAKLPKDATQAREDAIFSAVQNGMARIDWVNMPFQVGDYEVSLPVMARTLRIGRYNPVRVSCNYATCQKIADLLGAAMMTPQVADITRTLSTYALNAAPQNKWVQDGSMAKTKRMIEYSSMLDAKVPVTATELTSNEGKQWVVTARFWNDSNPDKRWPPNKRSANYGWWSPSAPYQGTISKMWQTTGLAHNFQHVDYSQQIQLMSQRVFVSGYGEVHVGSVLKHPTLNALLSNEGALPSWAHPAFDKSSPDIA